MKTATITTTDLSEFGIRERRMLVNILESWEKDGLPDEFVREGIQVVFHKDTGDVFLTNASFQIAYFDFETSKLVMDQ